TYCCRYCHRCLRSLPMRFHFTPIRLPLSPTLFPYTTLFRSLQYMEAANWGVRGLVTNANTGAPLFAKVTLMAPANSGAPVFALRSEEHTSELQSHLNLVCRLLLEKKKKTTYKRQYIQNEQS